MCLILKSEFVHQLVDFNFAFQRTDSVVSLLGLLSRQLLPHCPDDFMQCTSAFKCVPLSWLCDGDNDCGDNSDETVLCSMYFN